MKTTLNLDDAVVKRAKKAAAREGITLTKFIEDALRAKLLPAPKQTTGFKLVLPIVKGKGPPVVDIADRDALYDLMERS